ncbi:citryl-CoA lyase [Streptomyces sp. NPDC047002]|uniref:citryl-CoA lyase n=1 Tax=Streptomyces sp. NPDC047002 TaxID=3155475 RepID=UPI003454DDD5
MPQPHQTMAAVTPDGVTVKGLDLVDDLIGAVPFTDMVHLEITGRLPGPGARAALDAVLVALTEHGMTATAVAARLTDLGAPGALQGAVAAGLLGAGDRFLGALDGAARLLQEWPDDAEPDAHARRLAEEARSRRDRLPGLGHPVHTEGDPRTARLFAVADAAGLDPAPRERFLLLRHHAERAAHRTLPVNVDGASAVLLTAAGIPWQVCRGIALVARAAGLVGHLWDEHRAPAAQAMLDAADAAAPYGDPEATK